MIGQPCACGAGSQSIMRECRCPPRSTVTLANPDDWARFGQGDVIVFSAGRPRWWKRLWRWIKRGFRKPPPPPRYVVTAVKSGTIEIGEAG